MKIKLDNGTERIIDSAGHIICPIPDVQFDIDDPETWESDRAWIFAKVGCSMWTGVGNEVAKIVSVT